MATMDVKQLHDAGKQIFKAAESGEGSQVLLQLLAPLEQVKATEDLLRQSKIGVAVTKLRQSKDPKVSELATRLVNRWKTEVNQGKKKRMEGSPAPAGKTLNGAVNGRSGTSSPAPSAVKAEPRSEPATKYAGDPAKRNTKVDGVKHDVTGDAVRDGCLKLMYDGIAFMSHESPSAILDVARQVEAAAFDLFKRETDTAYRTKMRSLFQNLKIQGNKNLRISVFNGKIPPSKFVAMTSDDLKSAEKRAEDAAMEKENMSKAMTAQQVKAISTTLQCGKCKKSAVSYSEAQTRSADEPLTVFCECTLCGHRWKQG